MILNEKQEQDVRTWLADGASLADVQRQLLEIHDINITYMDLRLLILEMDATVQDKPEPVVKEDKNKEGDEASGEAAGTGGVSVTLDRVVQAGAIASGTVRFSDGVHGAWMLDQMGRLGLSGMSQADYQPSPEDVQAFQAELQSKLTTRGM